ncbi:MAG: hypothetical protein AAFR71_07775 [Pseudomonadota bacterium]
MVSDGTRTLVWDAQNKLASVTPNGGGQAVTFQYGPDGARIAKLSSYTLRGVSLYRIAWRSTGQTHLCRCSPVRTKL